MTMVDRAILGKRRWLLAILLTGMFLLLGGCEDNDPSFASEGTPEAPIDIGAASLTHSGTVAGGGNSYYTTTTDNGNWLINVSNIDGDPDLRVYEDPDFLALKCTSSNAGTTPDSCPVGCVGSCRFYLRIFGFSTQGGSYTLSVSPFVP